MKDLKDFTKKYIGVIVLILCVVYSALVLFALKDKAFLGIKFKEEISLSFNAFNVISSLITVALAIYITGKLSKENDVEKQKKLLYSNYFESFHKQYSRKIYNIIGGRVKSKTLIKSDLKILRSKCFNLISVAEDENLIDKNSDFSLKINAIVTEIWGEFTLESDLNEEDIAKIEQKLNDLDKNVLLFLMKINSGK